MDSLDPLLKQFFAQAKAISLTSQESKLVWSNISELFSESLVRDGISPCLSEHMTHKSHSFSKDAQRISMTDAENNRLQKAISAFVVSNPVRVKETMHHKGQFSLESIRESIVSFLSPLRPMPVIAAIAALFVSFGGVSYAAESTVPGDLLYPVKIHVNENVSAAFHVSSESKADFYADLAEERAEEAQKLAAEGRLNAEARAELAKNFSLSLEKAQKRIQEVSAEGDTQAALELSSRLEGQLEGYALALRALSDTGMEADASAEAAAFLTVLEQKHKDAVDARTKAEVNVSASTSATMEADARARIAEVKKAVASVKAGTDAAASAQLKVATDLLLKAEADLNAGTYNKALLEAANAERHAQKATIFSSVQNGLHLGVKNHSSSSTTSSSSSSVSSVTSSTSSAPSSLSSSSTPSSTSSAGSTSSQADASGQGSVKIKSDVKVKVDSKVNIKTGL